MLRALQSDFDFDDGVALLDSAPFTGLAFETDEACGLIDVHFLSGTIACKAIAGWKSYSNGKAGGKFKPGSLEEKYALAVVHFGLISGRSAEFRCRAR